MAGNISTKTQKALIIIGGSYGGVSTAHYLLKHVLPGLPAKHSYKVVLISSTVEAMCRPACPRALISDEMFAQDRLFVSVEKQFEQYPATNFRFIHGTVSHLNHIGKTLSINTEAAGLETLAYHALVIATGASTPSPLLGLNQDRTDKTPRESWIAFRKALTSVKTIIIGGGGPAAVETAGELGEFLNGRPGLLSKAVNSKVNITIVTAASQILPALRPSIAKEAEVLLAKVGVTVIHNSRVQAVTPEGSGIYESLLTASTTVTLEDGTKLDADLYIPAIGTVPNTKFVDRALLGPDDRIDTNASTLRVDNAGPKARIYAIGDASSFARPAIHNIIAAAPVLCANLKRDLLLAAETESTSEDRVFEEDVRETQLVPIGRSKGVGAANGWQLPSLMVWLIKGRDYWLWTTGALWSGKQWAKEA